jgi:ligand-binding SRPBCC domain-containing protein
MRSSRSVWPEGEEITHSTKIPDQLSVVCIKTINMFVITSENNMLFTDYNGFGGGRNFSMLQKSRLP